MKLYCVGCGTNLWDSTQAEGMAMACGTCEAYSPICVPDLQTPQAVSKWLPYSLIRILSGERRVGALPHIEVYIGYSDFTCAAKEAWAEELSIQGLRSQSECDQEKCLERYSRNRNRVLSRAKG